MCRIDDAYDMYFSKSITRPDYYRLNLEVCYELQVAAGLPIDKRVDKLFIAMEN